MAARHRDHWEWPHCFFAFCFLFFVFFNCATEFAEKRKGGTPCSLVTKRLVKFEDEERDLTASEVCLSEDKLPSSIRFFDECWGN